MQDSVLLPKGDLANQFKPVVPWPHVEGVEVDLNSVRLKNGETLSFHDNHGAQTFTEGQASRLDGRVPAQ